MGQHKPRGGGEPEGMEKLLQSESLESILAKQLMYMFSHQFQDEYTLYVCLADHNIM